MRLSPNDRRRLQTPVNEVAHDLQGLLGHPVAHRELVILGLDAVLFEDATCLARGMNRNHVVLSSVNDEDMLARALPQRRKVTLIDRAAHADDAGNRLFEAKANIE